MDIYLDIAQVLVTALLNIAFAVLVGVLLADRALAGDDPAQVAARRQLLWVGLSAACVLVASQWLGLWLQSAALTGTPVVDAASQLLIVLTESHYGAAWLLGYGAALVLLATLITHYIRSRTQAGLAGSAGLSAGLWTLASVCVALLALAKSATGHAAYAGDLSLPECVAWLHLCATAAWAGLVLVSAWVVVPALRAQASRTLQMFYLNGLSHSAGAAFLAVLVTGGFNAWHESGGTWAEIAASPWGHILQFKLVLVLLILVTAGVNRIRFLPRLAHSEAALRVDLAAQERFDNACQAFARLIALEAVLMLAVLTSAAFLGHIASGI